MALEAVDRSASLRFGQGPTHSRGPSGVAAAPQAGGPCDVDQLRSPQPLAGPVEGRTRHLNAGTAFAR